MVKVGILGSDTLLAGEIIRILINHPETELISLYAPALMGRSVSTVHHGLIGETAINFTDKINLDEIDFLIIAEESELSQTILKKFSELENLKIGLSNEISREKCLAIDFETGLSEINRKALVRGATAAFIPSPIVVPVLIALVPLANYLLLNSDIKIEESFPSDISQNIDLDKEINFLNQELKKVQSSFNGIIQLSVTPDQKEERTGYTKISFECALPIDEIEKIYDQIYDDHNFTFITGNEPSAEEVEGTQKTLLKISKPEPGILQIEIIIDARMRGGAGDMVHLMNLFFGLHEKTGLTLKPSRYKKK